MAESAAQAVLSEPRAYQGEQKKKPKRMSVVDSERWLKVIRSKNLAADKDIFEPGEVEAIGQRAMRGYGVDQQSRSDWLVKMGKAMDYAMQVAQKKSYPFPGASNIKYPVLTTAAVQFNARAYPALVPPGRIVKAKVNGRDDGVPQLDPGSGQPMINPETQEPVWEVDPGAKRKRAERVSKHMSYQLTEEDEPWEGETDKLLMVLPIIGCCFRKSTHDTVEKVNRSELIMPDELVVNYRARSLERASRVTHVFRLEEHEIQERVKDGRFLDIEYGQGRPLKDQSKKSEGGTEEQTAYTSDEEAPHYFLEQHRWEDLDGDGLKEPYIVTLHEATEKVVRIVARFALGGLRVNEEGDLVKIEPIHYFTKYSFLPNPDGGFYDLGFGLLLGPISESISTTLNLMFDAGHLQNAGGGLISKQLRLKAGNLRVRPGEWKQVDTIGSKIADSVHSFNHPGPSMALFHLLGLLIEATKDITSVKDVMTGDAGPANEAAVRTMARIEQGMKVFTAIYKRVFRAMKAEFKKLFRLNFIYLEEETYFNFQDTLEQVSPDDYDEADLDITPVADPKEASDLVNAARAEFLMNFINDPFTNPVEARKRIFDGMGLLEIEKLIVTQPPPDPKVAQEADEIEISKARNEIEARKVDAEVIKLSADATLALAKAEETAKSGELKAYIEQLKSMTKLATEEIKARNSENAKNNGTGADAAAE